MAAFHLSAGKSRDCPDCVPGRFTASDSGSNEWSLFRGFFRVHAAKQTIAIILLILLVAFIMAAFYTNAGEFVVKVDREMARDGFYLSEIPNFDEKLITLHADALVDATNISIYNIDEDVMDIDGEHHSDDVFA